MRVIDVNDPDDCKETAFFPMSSVVGLTLSGNLAYLAADDSAWWWSTSAIPLHRKKKVAGIHRKGLWHRGKRRSRLFGGL
jgi:hypothetical protein